MKKPKARSGLLKYWPHLTGKLAELERQKLSDAQGACCAICGKHESMFNNRYEVELTSRGSQIEKM